MLNGKLSIAVPSKGRLKDQAAELFEQAVEQERQRFEQDDGVLQFDRFFEPQRSFDRNQRAACGAARQLLQAETFLSETLAERYFR